MELDLSAFDEAQKKTTPAKQELDLSAFDTATPTEQFAQPSQLEAGVRGAAQGLSMGFSDELTGLVESLLSDKSYQQARDESRAAYKAAEQAHPITYTGSEIVSGFAVPGLGWAKGGAGALKGLAKVGARAAEGAALGGLGAYGMSEKEGVEGLKEGAKGATVGAVAAPVLGGLLDKVIPTTKLLSSNIVDPDVVETAYQKARAGQSLAGKEALEQSHQSLLNYVRDDLMPLILDDSKKVVSKAYDEALAQARAMGKTVSVDDLMSRVDDLAARERMAPEDVQKIRNTLDRFGQKEEVITGVKQVNPMNMDPQAQFEQKQIDALKRQQDVKEMRSQLARAGEPSIGGQQPGVFEGQGPAFGSDLLAAKSQSASPTIKAMNPYTGRGETSSIDYITSEIFQKPNLTVDDLTDLKRKLDVMAKSSDPLEAQAAIEMSQQVKGLIRQTAGTDNYKMADEMRKIQSDIEAKFGVGSVEGAPILTKDRQAYEAKARAMTKNLVARQSDPANLQGLSVKEGFDQLSKLLPQQAEDAQRQVNKLAQEARTAETLAIPINPFHPESYFSLRPAIAKSADFAGKGVKKIHEWTDNDLAKGVQYLYTSGKSNYAKMLEKAMMAPGEKRRALLFSLTQNPEFRNAFPGFEEE